MSALLLMLIALAALSCGYIFYGSYIAKKLGVDPKIKTPAHTLRDDVDYVPTRAPVLMGHHFASIAGAAPIIGPTVAAVFGWIPVFLWIVLGGIFLGAVHDFQSLVTSIRHRGKTISEVLKENVGISSKKLFAALALFAGILVLALFAMIVANTFVAMPGVATASLLFIVLAIFFGYAIYRRGAPLLWSSVVGVVLLVGCIWLGFLFPISLSFHTWLIILLAYALVAATLPVWFILQPRDYLNSFLLYALLAAAVIGIFVTNPAIKLPAFTSFETNLGYLFPILFVTVACGAISGFHCMVASGTTSKQLSSEAHAKPIGYGGMLLENLMAVIAITAVAILVMGDYTALMKEVGPVGVFSAGVAGFLTGLGIPVAVGMSFAALVLCCFAMTTLDTCTRLSRFLFVELTETEVGKPPTIVEIVTNRWVAGTICVVLGLLLAWWGTLYAIWPVFGAANQLLAALALLAGAVWLARLGKDNWFVVYPMIFMLAVTMTALVLMFIKQAAAANIFLAVICVVIFGLAIIFFYLGVTKLLAVGKEKRASG